MKKILMFMSVMMATLVSFSQEKINEFQMSYFDDNPVYDISAVKNGDTYDYYLSMFSFEGERSPVVLVVKGQNNKQNLINSITEARDLYDKWNNISLENNVVDLNREMNIKTKGCDAAFLYGRDWRIDFSVLITYVFKHVDGKAKLIVKTGGLQASSNQYIDSDGGAFVFSSVEEINNFIELLDDSYAKTYFDEKEKTNDLFSE